MTRHILVTGGSGLVGRALRELVEGGPTEYGLVSSGGSEGGSDSTHPCARAATWTFLSSADADLTDPVSTDRVFAQVKPTHVIHLAAAVGGLFCNMRSKVEFFRKNLAINDNVLRASHVHGVTKVVSCLSTCIFPDGVDVLDETMVHCGPPHPSNEGYAYAKRMLDVLSRCYREQYGCNFVTVAPTNVFGSHDNFNLEDAHVLPALIHKAYIAARDGCDFVVAGSGRPLRQFIYAPDLAVLLLFALDHHEDAETLILAPGGGGSDGTGELSIAQVAETVAAVFDIHADRIVYDTDRPDGQFKKTASNRKLRQLLANVGADFKFTEFKTAIRETAEWFSANYDTVRK